MFEVLTNTDGEKFIDIGKKRRLTVRSFKGSLRKSEHIFVQ